MIDNEEIKTHAASKSAIEYVRSLRSGEPIKKGNQPFIALQVCAYRANRYRSPSWIARHAVIVDGLTNLHIGLAHKLYMKYSRYSNDEASYMSAAFEALLRSITHYDPFRGYQFSTYAYNVIARSMYRVWQQHSREIARQLDQSRAQAQMEERHDEPLFDADQIAFLLRVLERNDALLTHAELEVIRMRFFEKLTLKATGEHFGLSKERARQLQNSALKKLRETIVGEDS